MSLCSFLDDPNPFTPARHDVASVYINDPCAYEAGVRQGVEMFAVGMRPAKEELEKEGEEEN
jgi:ubiquitin-protein ligase